MAHSLLDRFWIKEKSLFVGHFAVACGVIVALLSSVVMVGWYIKSSTLVQINPAFAPMQFNTALCFLCVSIGLLALHFNRSKFALTAGGGAVLVAAVTLVEYVSGISLGIDTLFVEPFTITKTSDPGRMSPNTMLCFLLCGTAILMQASARLHRYKFMAGTLGIFVLVLAASALIGYMTGITIAHGWGNLSRMALHTASGFLLISSGLCAYIWRVAGRPVIATISLAIPIMLGCTVLVIDLLAPLGVATSMMYALVILCGLKFRHPYAVFVIASVTSFMTVIGYFNVPLGEMASIFVLANRLLAILAQWVVAFIVYFHKKAMDALEENSLQVEVALKNVFGAIITIDTTGIIQMFNPAAEKIFGYEAEEVIGKNIKVLMPEPYYSEHDKYISNYLTTGQAKIIGHGREVTGLRKDGTMFPMELGVSKAEIHGKPMFVGLLHDITARKEAEESVKIHVDALEQSNRELDEFAYIASHDLKEPLRGIYNYSSFLMEDYQDKLDEDGKSKLRTLMKLSQRLEVLIDSLLYFSRVGRSELSVKETDLAAVLEEVIFSLRPFCEETGAEIRVMAELPTMQCDSVRTGEVFRNLISNAIKYNDKEKKQVSVGYKKSPEGDYPVFYVQDNGIGIPEKHYESIFRIFKRLHGREKFNGGTGAGLTIARKIVERHGGHIWLESEEGKGTTFYFTLQRGSYYADSNAIKTAPSHADRGGQQRGLYGDGTRVA